MNKTYRLIWNRRLGAWVAAAETTCASGKKSSGRARAGVAAVGFAVALGASLPLAAADLAPGALPTGGTVAAGQAAIAASGTRMDITQSSQKAIINWQGFDIGSQAQVNFAQPNAAAVALNRVSGPNISRIEGQLTANGQVFLVNPSGVIFGNGARVNAGAFVASTLNIRDDDFLAGNYAFTGTGGAIENRGTISAAPGGYVAFIAPKITNAGTVSAPQGTVAMGAGERVTLNFAGDRLVGLSVATETLDTLIENRQAIRAEGGAILLTAAGAEAVTRGVINNTGALEASSLTGDGGHIVLTAGNEINLASTSTVAVDGKKGGEITVKAKSGTLLADGSLSARGASGTGGSVQLVGQQVGLVNAAQVDASGATGGGTVLVGGDYQGGNGAVQNAFRTYVGPQAAIKADALQQGDGGKVIVWADDATRFYGKISATGGTLAGNGGFVEVSGKGYLDFNGVVDTTALTGTIGTLLLDPTNIDVITGGTATLAQVNQFADPDLTASCAAFGGAGCSRISPATINAAAANVVLQATNNILFTNAVSMTNAGVGLTATAQTGNITVNAPITTANRATSGTTGAVTLSAGGNVALNAGITTGSATVADAAGNQTAASGNIGVTAGTGISGAGRLITGNAALTGAATGTETIRSGTITLNVTGAGAVGLSGANALTIGAATGNGAGSTATSGNITFTSADRISNGTAGGAIDVSFGAASGGATNTIGSLAATTDGGAGASGEIVITSGEALRLGALNAAGGAITLDVGAATTAAGVIGGAGTSLTKLGSGTLMLSGANAYTGATNINAGTLALGAANRINDASAVTVASGATFDLGSFGETIGSLAGAGTVTKSGATASTLAVGGNNTSTTFSGVIQQTGTGALSLTKNGTGTLTLSGNNTYGGTTISAGTLQVGAGGTTGTLGTGAVTDNGALVFNRSDALTVTAAINGTGTLIQAGTGTTTLTANNAYTGTTTISAGTLQIGGGGTAGALGTGAVVNNAALVVNRSNSLTVANAISGTGTLTQAGTGTTTLTGTNTYSGTTTINAGTLQVGAGGTTGTLGTGAVTNNGALIFNRSNALTVANAIGGTGTLTKTSAGTLTLSGVNTYTGATNINGGTLTASGGDALPDASQVTLANNAGATLNLANSETIGNLSGGGTTGGNVTLGANTLTVNESGTTTYSGVVGGTGGLTKAGTGTLTMSGANTYTGATAINAGTLAVTANNALGTTAAGTSVASGATLDFRNVAYATAEAVTLNGGTLATSTGTSSFAGPVTLGANGNVDVGGTQLTLSGVIGGAGFGIAKQGSGTLLLSGNNTYTGATNINAGTLTASGGNAIPDASQVNLANVAGATLNLASSETIGNLAGGGAAGGNVTLGANTLTVSQTAATTYAGTISGSGGLTKTGAGTLTLAGANTYAGITNINAGMLVAANAAALGGTGGGTNVGSSARLSIDSVALGAEPVTLNGPGLFGSGAITSSGSASLAGLVTLAGDSVIAPNGGSTLTLSGPVDGAFGLTTDGNGTLNLNGAVGGVTPLTFLTTGANGATGIGASVRTTGNQTYNNPTTLASGVVLQSTAGSLSAPGAVVASAGPVSLSAAGNLVFQNAANDFSTVAINAGANVALRDSNAIDLGGSTIGGSLSLVTGGTVTDSGAISVGGATTINAGAANDITLDNTNNFAGNVSVQSGRNVRLNDVNNLTLDLSSFSTLTATASGTMALAGTLTASGTGDAIVLSGSRFVNSAGAGALSAPSGRWLVWSSNPSPFSGATPDNRGGLAYDFKQYNATYGVTPVQGTGNGFLYAVAPTITPGLTGTVSKVYDTTTTAPLTAANFTPTTGLDGDVITMTGTGAYDNPNVAGSPTKLVTASGISATITSSVTEGSKPVYGYTLTSTTASANIGEITPAPLTITGNTASSVYTAAAQTNGFTTSGLLGSDSVTGIATLASGTNVGTYNDNLTSATGTGLSNYTIGYVNGSLTITPAPLTITANDASRPVNTPNPQFTASYAGFVGGETPAVLNGALSFSTPATQASPVGIYPITPYGQSSGNYAITYVDGDLTVSRAPVITPTLPREAVNQQAIAAQYTDPTMSTEALTGPYYVFDNDSKDGMPPASAVRVVGSGIRLPN